MTGRVWYAICALFTSVVLVGVTCIVYVGHVARESEAKWCGIVVTLDEANDAAPAPTTEYGKRLASDIERLVTDLNCNDNAGQEVRDNG